VADHAGGVRAGEEEVQGGPAAEHVRGVRPTWRYEHLKGDWTCRTRRCRR
jgi:hypothetical protein